MEPKVGVYICHCGANIASIVDVEKVTEFAKGLPSVAMTRDYKFVCSDPGQELIRNDIRELGLNRIVVASCSPRLHEQTFRLTLASAGLNPYLFEMANIREHCSWVHEDGGKATEKAKALVNAAVRRVLHQVPHWKPRRYRSTQTPSWLAEASLAYRQRLRSPILVTRFT